MWSVAHFHVIAKPLVNCHQQMQKMFKYFSTIFNITLGKVFQCQWSDKMLLVWCKILDRTRRHSESAYIHQVNLFYLFITQGLSH